MFFLDALASLDFKLSLSQSVSKSYFSNFSGYNYFTGNVSNARNASNVSY